MFGFFRPKWQHRNPSIRIEAIRSLALDKETILKIVQTDNDVNVRIAALQYIDELNILYALLLQEPCINGKTAILKQISTIFLKAESPERMVQSFMTTIVRRDFPVADLLMVCENLQLKQYLFPMINLQKDLPKLVESHYNFSVEELVLIDNLEILNHLVKKANITDKKVLAHLKETLQKKEEIEHKAALKEQLLMQYIALSEADPLAPLNVFSALEQEWNKYQLGDEQLPYKEVYLARYHAYNELRQNKIMILQKLEQQVQNEEIVEPKQILLELKDLLADSIFSLKEKNEIQVLIQKIDAYITDLKQREQDQALKAKKAQSEKSSNLHSAKNTQVAFDSKHFDESLQDLDKLIASGSLQKAEQLNQKLIEALKALDGHKDSAHYTRLLKQSNQPLYDQLDTARWGIYRNLELLCDQAESLANSVSIDLISITLKQLRKDWNISKKGIARVPQKLYQRFESACKIAHQRLVNERDHNNQARAVYLKEAEELLGALSELITQIDWANPDWNHLIEMRQKFLQEWNRYLNQYSTDGVLSYGAPLFLAKDKQKLERSMRQILKPLDVAMQNERKKEKQRREDEITLLQQLLDGGNIRDAVEKAKQFNRTFNPTVRSKRHDENVLWKKLRVVNDQIFALREEFVSAEESEKIANGAQKRMILDELKALYESITSDHDIAHIESSLQMIENRWMDIGVVAKHEFIKLEGAFKTLLNKIQKQLQNIDLQKEILLREDLLCTSLKIGQLEAEVIKGQEIVIEEQLVESADANLRKRLKCLEQIIAGQESARAFLSEKSLHAEQVAFELVLHREILLDKTSPIDERDARLAMQVKILEDAMNNQRSEKDKKHQLKLLDDKWLENVVGKIPDSLYQRFR